MKIIMQTRRQYLEGIQMNEFYPLVWEDFTNKDALTENYEEIQDENMNILDRNHLLTFAHAYTSDEELDMLSEGEDVINNTLEHTLRRNSSDRWSIQTPRKCANLAASRRRSVSVSENCLGEPDIVPVSTLDQQWYSKEDNTDRRKIQLQRRNAMRRRGPREKWGTSDQY